MTLKSETLNPPSGGQDGCVQNYELTEMWEPIRQRARKTAIALIASTLFFAWHRAVPLSGDNGNTILSMLGTVAGASIFVVPAAYIYFRQSRIASLLLLIYFFTAMGFGLETSEKTPEQHGPMSFVFLIVGGLLSIPATFHTLLFHAVKKFFS